MVRENFIVTVVQILLRYYEEMVKPNLLVSSHYIYVLFGVTVTIVSILSDSFIVEKVKEVIGNVLVRELKKG